MVRTSLVVELLEHLSDDLSHTLQGLDVLLRLMEVLVEVPNRETD